MPNHKDNTVLPPSKNFFPSWNNCEALTTLQKYVEDVTNPKSPNYISAEDRIATFDMDGTFVGELYPSYFEYNLLEYRVLDDALVESIGIEPNRVIGMDVWYKSINQGEVAGVNYTMGKEEYLIRTDSLIIKDLKTNKVLQISQEIGKVPVLSFGNSGGDCAMHNYCLSNNKYRTAAFMLIADDEARDHANREKALKLGAQWRDAVYYVISMRDDFRTIYGFGVEKVDFTFPVD